MQITTTNRIARSLPLPARSAAASEQPAVGDRVQLTSKDCPPASEDHDWSRLGRAAAITAGVVGGAVLASVVAQAAGIGGMNLGSILMNGLYHEALPKAVALTTLLGATDKALLAAPLLGGVAGGIIGGIASYKKSPSSDSKVPGSGLDQHKEVDKESISGLPRWTWAAVKTSVRDAGEAVHDGVNGVSDADCFKGAAKSGASAGYAFGSRIGGIAGKTLGFVQGGYLGALVAGMPFAFAPLTAIPVAIVGAWALGNAMETAGGFAGGALAGAGGAAAGAVGHGVKQLVHHG